MGSNTDAEAAVAVELKHPPPAVADGVGKMSLQLRFLLRRRAARRRRAAARSRSPSPPSLSREPVRRPRERVCADIRDRAVRRAVPARTEERTLIAGMLAASDAARGSPPASPSIAAAGGEPPTPSLAGPRPPPAGVPERGDALEQARHGTINHHVGQADIDQQNAACR